MNPDSNNSIPQPVLNETPNVIPSNTATTTPVVENNTQQSYVVTQPSAPEPKNSPVKYVIAGFLVLIVLVGGYFGYKSLKNKITGGSKTLNLPTTEESKVITPSKYATDFDLDNIPDEIETALGFNTISSEITRCEVSSCGEATAVTAESLKNNILFIIDSSGSMNSVINGKTKMDLAKDAIRNFLKSVAGNVNIGIMVYGDKGSNSATDKSLSCSSAEIIAPLGSVSSANLETYLAGMKPVGWTPIGLSIRKAKDAFSGKEGQKNQIIVVTDGAETCDSNPTGAATEVKNSAYQIRVDVIGFAVNATEQSSLQSISTNGGGLFSVAMNSDELLSKMQASHANFEKFQTNAKCTSDVYSKSVTCLQDVNNKTYSYISNLLLNTKGAEYGELSNLQLKISKIYNDKINSAQDEWNKSIRASQQILK